MRFEVDTERDELIITLERHQYACYDLGHGKFRLVIKSGNKGLGALTDLLVEL